MKKFFCTLPLAALLWVLPFTLAHADRIKDLTTMAAMRGNQLIGYGLVVGLQGTGDMAAATRAGWATSVLLKIWPF